MIVLILASLWTIYSLREAASSYDATLQALTNEKSYVTEVKIDETTVRIPSYELFRSGKVWSLTSKKHPLTAEPAVTLVEVPVAHGDAASPMKVNTLIGDPLAELVAAASVDGESLMVSSAYRSMEEQRQTRESYVVKYGEAMANQYVSPVGASEHHTGLAVDFSSVSEDCAKDSNTCSLGQSGAAWLAENASRFGFILRYPETKQPITGVAFEPWHYRYVGLPLAKAMQGSDLTFDEVIMQIAPGYAR